MKIQLFYTTRLTWVQWVALVVIGIHCGFAAAFVDHTFYEIRMARLDQERIQEVIDVPMATHPAEGIFFPNPDWARVLCHDGRYADLGEGAKPNRYFCAARPEVTFRR